MRKTLQKVFLLALCACALSAQVVTILGTDHPGDSRAVINSNFLWIQAHPFSEGAALPGTCATGERYYQTSLGLLYRCTATNAWTPDRYLVASSAPAACALNDVWLDTSGPTWRICTSPGAPGTWTAFGGGGTGDVSWGDIGGSLNSQSDLWNALQGKSNVGHGHSIAEITTLQSTLNGKESSANKGQPSGYAGLGADGKVPAGQLPDTSSVLWGGIGGTLSNQGDLAAALAGKESANANIQAHISSTLNPHSTTKTQVGLGSVTNDAQLKISSNLADLASSPTARANLGLGGSAVLNVGTVAGTVAAGDHLHGGVYAALAHVHAASDINVGLISPARLGAGTADSSVVLYGDNVWRVPSGGGGGGSVNTASNQGTVGVGLFKQLTTADLEFYKINPATNKVSIALVGTDRVDIGITEANIVHQNLSGAGTNTHAQIDTHLASTSNPHSTTAAQVGAPALTLLTTLGDTTYHDGSAWARLAGSIVAAKRLMCQTGTGTVSAAPAWCALAAGDIPDISATYQPLITAGTSAQYWRGDKSWQTLNATAVGLGNVPNVNATTFTPSGNIAASTVAGAIAELDAEKDQHLTCPANNLKITDGSAWTCLALGTGFATDGSTLNVDTATVSSFAASTTVPGSCTVPWSLYFDTDAATGAKLYYCNITTGQYEAVAGSGSGPTFTGTNTYTAGTNDFSGTTSFIDRVASTLSMTTAGERGYDSTQKAFFGYSASTASRGSFTRVPQGWILNASDDFLCANSADTGPGTCTTHVANTTPTAFRQKIPFPADFYSAYKTVRVQFGLQATGSSTPPGATFTLKLGSVVLWQSSAASFAGSGSNKGFSLTCTVTAAAAPSATTNVFTHCYNFGTTSGGVNNIAQPVSVATNASGDLQLYLTDAVATAGNWMWQQQVIGEELN